MSFSTESIQSTICDNDKIKSYHEIANLFVETLLNMKSISSITNLNCEFHELMLFPLVTQSELTYHNKYYILNDAKYFRSFRTAKPVIHCESNENFCIPNIFNVDEKYFYFLRNVINQKKSNDGKYYCNIKCEDLFDLIANKLESLNYKYDDYVKMEKELKELENEMNDLITKQKCLKEKYKDLNKSMNSAQSICTDYDENIKMINQIADEILNIENKKNKYNCFKKIIVPENIRRALNIKIFLNAIHHSTKIESTELTEVCQHNNDLQNNNNYIPSAPPISSGPSFVIASTGTSTGTAMNYLINNSNPSVPFVYLK